MITTRSGLNLIFLTSLLLIFNQIECFNVDVVNYVKYEGQPDSMFGFSVALHQEQQRSWWVIAIFFYGFVNEFAILSVWFGWRKTGREFWWLKVSKLWVVNVMFFGGAIFDWKVSVGILDLLQGLSAIFRWYFRIVKLLK